jgi:hypothetical protein
MFVSKKKKIIYMTKTRKFEVISNNFNANGTGKKGTKFVIRLE